MRWRLVRCEAVPLVPHCGCAAAVSQAAALYYLASASSSNAHKTLVQTLRRGSHTCRRSAPATSLGARTSAPSARKVCPPSRCHWGSACAALWGGFCACGWCQAEPLPLCLLSPEGASSVNTQRWRHSTFRCTSRTSLSTRKALTLCSAREWPRSQKSAAHLWAPPRHAAPRRAAPRHAAPRRAAQRCSVMVSTRLNRRGLRRRQCRPAHCVRHALVALIS